ncbi:MAG: histidine phosphatase family protein [Deltaproteobacteria bacterium]|nr:histidine phosphatase family protein [Deltaproteobacteria bacterium]
MGRIRSTLPLLMLLSSFVTACGQVGLPKVVYVARHGQTEWNRVSRYQGDPDLDEVGYVNRVGLWLLLKDRPINAIYTSERLRTIRTAALLAKEKELTPKAIAALNEIEPGIFEGVCYARFGKPPIDPQAEQCKVLARGTKPELLESEMRRLAAQAEAHGLEGKLPLGESYRDVEERLKVFVQTLHQNYRDSEVLIVAHGVVNRILLAQLLGWPLESTRRLKQYNDQVYRIEYGERPSDAKLFLYTPGAGWKRCLAKPTEGQRFLDCDPSAANEAPASQPTQH